MDNEVKKKRKHLMGQLRIQVAHFLEAERSLWEIQKKDPPSFDEGLKKMESYGHWITARADSVQMLAYLDEQLELLTAKECG